MHQQVFRMNIIVKYICFRTAEWTNSAHPELIRLSNKAIITTTKQKLDTCSNNL